MNFHEVWTHASYISLSPALMPLFCCDWLAAFESDTAAEQEKSSGCLLSAGLLSAPRDFGPPTPWLTYRIFVCGSSAHGVGCPVAIFALHPGSRPVIRIAPYLLDLHATALPLILCFKAFFFFSSFSSAIKRCNLYAVAGLISLEKWVIPVINFCIWLFWSDQVCSTMMQSENRTVSCGKDPKHSLNPRNRPLPGMLVCVHAWCLHTACRLLVCGSG